MPQVLPQTEPALPILKRDTKSMNLHLHRLLNVVPITSRHRKGQGFAPLPGPIENPTVAPQYYKAEDWVIRTWWSKT